MNRPVAVLLDCATLDLNDLDLGNLLSTDYDWRVYDFTTPEETAGRIQDAAVVVTNKVVIDQQHIQNADYLKLICVAATGYNNIDLESAKSRGIAITNTTGYGTPSVVQHVFALILALTTRLIQYHSAVKQGDWSDSRMFCLLDYPISEIAGKVLGIVGYGELGRGVARIAECFGMEVLLAARPGTTKQAERRPLREILPEVDILTLHCPLNDHTRNLIGERELAMMKPGALLINAARGGIVDELAVVEALHQGRLGGAGFDVLSSEPPVDGNPLLACDHPNLIVTPHCAWGSRESRQRLIDIVAANIRDYQAGKPTNRLDL